LSGNSGPLEVLVLAVLCCQRDVPVQRRVPQAPPRAQPCGMPVDARCFCCHEDC